MSPFTQAVFALVTTMVVNVAAVLVAYFSIRSRTDRIETNTNGNLNAANARADAAHAALAVVSKAVVDSVTTEGTPQ